MAKAITKAKFSDNKSQNSPQYANLFFLELNKLFHSAVCYKCRICVASMLVEADLQCSQLRLQGGIQLPDPLVKFIDGGDSSL